MSDYQFLKDCSKELCYLTLRTAYSWTAIPSSHMVHFLMLLNYSCHAVLNGDNVGRLWKEAVMAPLKHCPTMLLVRLMITIKTFSHNKQPLGQETSEKLPRYKAGILTLNCIHVHLWKIYQK
jgi:hypothetical protein